MAGPVRRRLAFEAVGSTNSLAMETARAGDPGPLWITAERQMEGRGRRGRPWSSPAGNLYASLLLVDPAPAEQLANLPLVVALGVREGLAALPGVDPSAVRIKWPNDILVGGAKCVGILIESERLSDGRSAVAIGCGVNVQSKPEGAPYPVASLREAGFRGRPDDVFAHLAEGVERALRRWDRGAGFACIRQGWIEAAIGLGESCTVNMANRSVTGLFVELDPHGRLVLERACGMREVFSAGDVFFAEGGAARGA